MQQSNQFNISKPQINLVISMLQFIQYIQMNNKLLLKKYIIYSSNTSLERVFIYRKKDR